ncbi:transposase, partial [bacterium]|nr:transposase [bacterium]
AKKLFAAKIKQIWLQPDLDSAMHLAQMLIDEYNGRFPEAIKTLIDGLEDSLQFYYYPKFDKRKISTTNTVERLNKEIRRRTKVVGVFPSRESYIRLVTTYVLEYTEDWITGKAYFSPESIFEMEPVYKERLLKLAA